jgi:hypothetical protein
MQFNDCRSVGLSLNPRRPDPVGAEARGSPIAPPLSLYTDTVVVATLTCTPMVSLSLSAQDNLQLVPRPLD